MGMTRLILTKIIKSIFAKKTDLDLNSDDISDFLNAHRLGQYAYCLYKGNEETMGHLDEYRMRYEKTLQLNEFYHRCVQEIFFEFQKRRLSCISTKGIWLISEIYKDFGCRPMSDIDILIDKVELDDIEDALKDMGYVQGHYNRTTKFIDIASKKDIVKSKLYSHESYPFVKIIGHNWVYVDLNFRFTWQISQKHPQVSFDVLYNNRSMSQDGSISFMNTYDNLIHLCCHIYDESIYFLYKYPVYRAGIMELSLGKLLDVFLIIQQGIDFDVLWSVTQRYQAEDSVSYVLSLLEMLNAFEPFGWIYKGLYPYSDKVNQFVDLKGRVITWPIDLYDRLCGTKEKNEFIAKLYQ